MSMNVNDLAGPRAQNMHDFRLNFNCSKANRSESLGLLLGSFDIVKEDFRNDHE
jgi:hypothetical protein